MPGIEDKPRPCPDARRHNCAYYKKGTKRCGRRWAGGRPTPNPCDVFKAKVIGP